MKQTVAHTVLAFAIAGTMVGCNSIIGLTQYSIDSTGQVAPGPDASSTDIDGAAGNAGNAGDAGGGGTSGSDLDGGDVSDAPRGDCVTNVECTQRLTAQSVDAGDGGTVLGVCVKGGGAHCVPLLSPECTSFVGPYDNDKAIILGTLFTITGAQAKTNIARQQSATLAAEQINMATAGVPGPNGPRPLVMVSCDESMLIKAGNHLVKDLQVPAIVGPNTSQDTLDLSLNLTIAAGTVVMTPTAVASSIADLADTDLTWLMVPSDVQRAPLMIKQLNDMETAVLADSARNITSARLAIVYRDDALGQGTRTSLNALTWSGKPLNDPSNYNGTSGNIRIEAYDPKSTADKWTALVQRMKDFAPDIIVVAGTAEAYTSFIAPLEAGWLTATKASRPLYMLIDSVKVAELLDATKDPAKDPEFRKRVRGTGVTSGGRSAMVLAAFNGNYQDKYGVPPSGSGLGPSFDATYAIAYALASTRDLPVTGANVAKGLRKLAGGNVAIDVGRTDALRAFSTLVPTASISATGTTTPLEWDSHGAPLGGTLEMWCLGAGATPGTAIAKSTGLTYDLKAPKYAPETYVPCNPP